MKTNGILVSVTLFSLFFAFGCKEKPEKPGKPTDLALAVVSQTEIDLSWKDNASNEAGFKVERSQAGGPSWAEISSVSANNSTFKNTGLTAGSSYSFRVMAYNEAGASEYSNIASAATLAPVVYSIPAISTAAASSVTTNSATSGGAITGDGNAAITSRGVCWSTTSNPTVAGSKTTDGSGTGSFTSTLSGLTASTQYYLRAYASNSQGTAYGEQVTFTTLSPSAPFVTTAAVTTITTTSATSGGNITNDGGTAVTARGVCWSTAANPTTSAAKTSDSNGTGTFTSSITGLNSNTTYYVRAYATNSTGTSYGDQLTFTTLVPVIPTVTTTPVSLITATTASSGGNITNDGGVAVTVRGVCWGTSANPTISGSKTSDGPGTGSFTSNITGLSPNTFYYIRSYATNSAGTAYGSQLTLTTSAPSVPLITTADISNITNTTAISGGNISSDGGTAVTARGICWSTSENPITANSNTNEGSGTGSFSGNMTGLVSNTLYYVRAFATNSAGTAYGNQLSFTTTAIPAVMPTVTTSSVSGIGTTSASSGGNITSNGGAEVTIRGVCWSTTANPTTANARSLDGAGSGIFTSNIINLLPGTTYHLRAYATNSAGTGYGSDLQFTSCLAPTITTTSASGVSTTTATLNGSVNANGNTSTITFEYGLTPGYGNSISASPGTISGTVNTNTSAVITGLNLISLYHYRIVGTNCGGTTYGSDQTFTTAAPPPTLTTTAISFYASTSALSGGNITSDGGAAVTTRGVCWSTSSNPTTANTKTTDGSGTGAFTSTITGLSPGVTYYVRAYATNSGGTGYGSNASFITPARVTDIDNNSYNVVTINNQQWMQQNLKVTKYNDGTNLVPFTDTAYIPVSYYHYYNNSASNGVTYGYMYNGFIIGTGKNICPTGWHIPTITEWSSLVTFLGGTSIAGGKMKETGLTYWNTPNTGADNTSLFSARGGGYYFNTYAGLKDAAIWWSNTPMRYVRINFDSGGITGTSSVLTGTDENSFYIRCKKD